MNILKISLMGIIVVVFAVQLKEQKQEYSLFLILGASLFLFSYGIGQLSSILEVLKKVSLSSESGQSYWSILVKMIGITYISEFASGKTDFSVVDGKHYGVPFDNGAAIACYRTDILQEAGMTLEDFTDITWDEWVEKGKVVLEKTGKPLLTTLAGECDLLTMMLQSAGASLFNEDGTTNIAKNDTLKKVIDTYCKMKDSGVLQEVNNWDEYTGSMLDSEVAGVINGCWIMGTIQTAEDQSGKWAITNIPKLTNVKGATNYSNIGGSSWAISGNCGNVELAEDFLASTFAGSTELYDNILSCGAIATWTPAGDSDAYAVPNEFFSGDAVFKKIVDYSTKVPSIITGPYFHEARDAISVATTNITNGADLEEELKKAEDTVNFNMGQ